MYRILKGSRIVPGALDIYQSKLNVSYVRSSSFGSFLLYIVLFSKFVFR